ncbi:DUF1439 domain-containing protein [Noviherbaspirillum suwonense]|uniref:DUF1439 domain-containing protein n=1 Tax=Noviherbaspirillum suwonense TaxID=1224511 RepID=A0ABY1Q553_9BURK|nr:DUF1439 domain-containing protein [Noviherbaspirillum suwonense]SMP59931.1 Protein of unknown function [Noviherbaspirillum suwonense]
MKQLWAVLPAALLLASCAALIGPRDVEVPQARLQESLEHRFPFNQRYLGLLDVSAVNPRVALLPEQNRISAAMDLSVRPAFGAGSGMRGSLTVSGVPRVDAARGVLLLGEPRVDDLNIDGLERGVGSQLAGVASFLAQTLIGELPVYHFAPETLRYAGVSFSPVKIVTRPDRVVVTFAPVK